MKKRISPLLALAAIMTACTVDANYSSDDLDDIDASMRFFEQGFFVPVGYSAPINLDSLIMEKDASGKKVLPAHFHVNGKGEYYIDFSGNIGKFDFSVPEVPTFDHISIAAATNKEPNPYPAGGDFNLPKQDLGQYNFTTQYSLHNNLTKSIIDVKSLKTKCTATLEVSSTVTGNVFVKTGSQLIYPDYMSVSKDNSDDYYKIVDNHIVEFTKEKLISEIDLSMNLDEIDIQKAKAEGKATVSDNKLQLSDEMVLNVNTFVEGNVHFPAGNKFEITVKPALSNIEIERADVQVQASQTCDEQNISFKMPELFAKESNFNLNDPCIFFPVKCDRGATEIIGEDFTFNIKATITAFNGTSVKKTFSIKNVKLIEGDNLICVSRLGNKLSGKGNTDVVIPDLNELFSGTMPDVIKISGVVIELINVDEDGNPIYHTVTTTMTPSLTVDYRLETYLDFLSGSYLTFSGSLNDNEIDLSKFGMKKTCLSFDFRNALPMSISSEFTVGITDGKGSRDIKVVPEQIPAGDVASPAKKHISIDIASEQGNLEKITGIKFALKTNVGANGAKITAEQFVKLEYITVSVEGGVVLEIQ